MRAAIPDSRTGTRNVKPTGAGRRANDTFISLLEWFVRSVLFAHTFD